MDKNEKNNSLETFTLKAKKKPEVDVKKMTKPENSKEKDDNQQNNK